MFQNYQKSQTIRLFLSYQKSQTIHLFLSYQKSQTIRLFQNYQKSQTIRLFQNYQKYMVLYCLYLINFRNHHSTVHLLLEPIYRIHLVLDFLSDILGFFPIIKLSLLSN